MQGLAGGRLHLRHGPIDLVLRAWGPRPIVATAYEAAVERFRTVLGELVGELPELRKPMSDGPRVEGAVAKRMVAACLPHCGVFVTPMAAVAGAVADEILVAMTGAAPLDKAFVNDGGDIAVHVAASETLAVGLAADFSKGPVPAVDGSVVLRPGDGVGGVATSGNQGRSLSFGIADSVTVLAQDAAGADAAATLIANAVDLPGHPAVRRAPARALDPDSDLGDLPVVVSVGRLTPDEATSALASGSCRAEAMRLDGLILGAALALRGGVAVVGDGPRLGLRGAAPQQTG